MNWAKIIAFLALTMVASAQTQPPPPQTARQAVLEMLFGKTPNAFQKHLPENALDIIGKTDIGLLGMFSQQISIMQRQALSENKQLETFDAGPFLLVSETLQGRQQVRTEIAVDRDDLSGDDDQIELSLNIYKDGILDRLPVVPNLILDMKEEKHIWRLNQLTLAIHIPLSDPDYVKGIAEDMRKTRQRMAEYGAMTSLQTLKALEASVQKKTSTYTCNLTELGKGWEAVPGSDVNGEEGPNSRKDYVFKIADCSSSSFHIVAEPAKNGPARRALCIDDAGTTLFSDDGKGASCISSGRPVKEMEEAGSGRAMGAID
jgi:hypothetical protein